VESSASSEAPSNGKTDGLNQVTARKSAVNLRQHLEKSAVGILFVDHVKSLRGDLEGGRGPTSEQPSSRGEFSRRHILHKKMVVGFAEES